MDYRYERTAGHYEDFASGRVLYNAQGTTSFPVRLASEIAQRCFALLREQGNNGPYTLYDPCCGGAGMLTVIGLLHGGEIHGIYASDMNEHALGVAVGNLALLTSAGMERRRKQLESLYAAYGKSSHQGALSSIDRLSGRLAGSALAHTACFQADATRPDGRREEQLPDAVDLIMTDLPYGSIVHWSGGADADGAASGDAGRQLDGFFEQAYGRLKPGRSVLAVVADKSQKLSHERFERVQHFKVGKRHVGLFVPLPDAAGQNEQSRRGGA